MLLTNILSMLIVQEPPVDGDKSIKDSNGTIERQLGDLSGWELAVGIAELDHGVILFRGKTIRNNAVVSSLLDGIIDRTARL